MTENKDDAAMAQAITTWSGNAVATTTAPDIEFSDVFSTRRPKNFIAGTSSGLQSIAKGVTMGVGAMVAAPAVGAQQDGVRGFCQGLGAGLCGAVVLPLVGCAVGVGQMVRGVYNTPESVSESVSGKRWDARKREWVADNLVDDAIRLSALDDEDIFKAARTRANGAKEESGPSSSGEVKDRGYYDTLQVEPTASQSEIKRSYYILARQLHPDKNPDDPEAHNKFQALGEAYQVIGNEDSRKKYDELGKAGLGPDTGTIDATAFFAMLFGSENFDHLVGRLKLAAIFAAGAELTRAESEELQERRETRLAIKLAEMLSVYDRKKPEEFKQLMEAQAATLGAASFGPVMLHTLGFVYKSCAEQFLGHVSNFTTNIFENLSNFASSTKAAFEDKAHGMKTRMNVVGSAYSVYKVTVSANDKLQAAEEGEKERIAHEMMHSGDVLPTVVNALWSATVIDIEHTITQVCERLLHDASVPRKQCVDRARALVILGQIFMSTKGAEGSESNPLRSAVEAAMMAALKRNDPNPEDEAEPPQA